MEMILSDVQAIELLKTKKGKEQIQAGLGYQSRLKVFTEPFSEPVLKAQSGYKEIVNTMKIQIDNEAKAEKTKKYFMYPLPITNVTGDIHSDLEKVFHARNAAFEITYNDAIGSTRQQELGQEVINRIEPRKYIEDQFKKVLLNEPNNVCVLDIDEDGIVYPIAVKNEDIAAIGYEKDGNTIKYICFIHSKSMLNGSPLVRYGFYDANSYRVIENYKSKYEVVIDNAHGLDYCPARHFMTAKRDSLDKFSRWNPFGKSLATLEKWTLFDVYTNYYEMYGVFPVVQIPQSECGACDDGFIITTYENTQEVTKTACPTCAKSDLMGAGTTFKFSVAEDKEDLDARGTVAFINPPIENLEFELSLQDKRIEALKKAITGVNSMIEKEAVNEQQVRGVMEDRRKPLLFIAEQLSLFYDWFIETAIQLQHDIQVSSFSNFGTEWYLMSEADIQELYKNAKESGMPENELSDLYALLIETKYKTEPNKIERLHILQQLNPAPFLTMDELIERYKLGVVTRDDLAIKANFDKYISRFEREEGDIRLFGRDAILQQAMTFETKINKIYNKLKEYSNETRNDNPEPIESKGDTSVD